MSTTEVFRRITQALDQAAVAYMLSGSFASAYYGAPRSTQDIDFVIDATAEQLRSFVTALPPDEYYAEVDAALQALARRSMFNVIDLISGWKIDLILRKSRPFSQEEFRRRRQATLQGLSLFIATAEDVIIAKLEWSKLAQSRRQLEDVITILRAQADTLDRQYLKRWIVELSLKDEWTAAFTTAGIRE